MLYAVVQPLQGCIGRVCRYPTLPAIRFASFLSLDFYTDRPFEDERKPTCNVFNDRFEFILNNNGPANYIALPTRWVIVN